MPGSSPGMTTAFAEIAGRVQASVYMMHTGENAVYDGCTAVHVLW